MQQFEDYPYHQHGDSCSLSSGWVIPGITHRARCLEDTNEVLSSRRRSSLHNLRSLQSYESFRGVSNNSNRTRRRVSRSSSMGSRGSIPKKDDEFKKMLKDLRSAKHQADHERRDALRLKRRVERDGVECERHLQSARLQLQRYGAKSA